MLATMQLINPAGSAAVKKRTASIEFVIPNQSSSQVAQTAFAKLNRWFGTSVFDLRSTDFQDFTESFQRIKLQIEGLLNSCAFDRKRLIADFNQQAANTLRSADDFKLDVLARLNRQGQIELLFMEQ